MSGNKFTKELYHSLAGINNAVERTEDRSLDKHTVQEYMNFLAEANLKSPGLLSQLDPNQFWNSIGYSKTGVSAHIARNLGKLKSVLDDFVETPVAPGKSFHFITDPKLRKILERDYIEIQKSVISENWKSTIILSGGALEAVLLDLLLKNETLAKSSSKAPKGNLNEWDLNELIETGVDIKIVDSQIGKLSHSVREYRNLIHPGVEIRKNLKIEPEEGKIAVEVLNILIRELS